MHTILEIFRDPNGATRQALEFFIIFAAALAGLVLGKPWSRWLMAAITVTALAMTVLAYLVRNPCRGPRHYYMGCGVWEVNYAGLATAAAMFGLGLWITVRVGNAVLGVLLMVLSVHYAEYMTWFYHTYNGRIHLLLGLTVTAIIAAYALYGVYQGIVRYQDRNSTARHRARP